MSEYLGYNTFGRGDLFERASSQFPKNSELGTRVEAHYARAVCREGMVLDVGAGTGRMARFLVETGFSGSIVAMEPAMSMLWQLGRIGQNGMGKLLPLVGASDDTIPFKNACFDSAYSFGVVPLVENWPDIIRPVAKSLKPDARFVFMVPSEETQRFWGLNYQYKKASFRKETFAKRMSEAGFFVEKVLPGMLLSPALLLLAWKVHGGKGNDLAIYSLRHWLENQLKESGDLAEWVSLETKIAPFLPNDTAVQSVVIVRPLKDLDGLPEIEPSFYPVPEAYDEICKVLLTPESLKILKSDARYRLLCLLDPILKHACRGRDVLADLFPERIRLYEETKAAVESAVHPNMRLQFMKKAGGFRMKALGKYYGALGRLKSLVG